jgi:MoaA/NifB/PqqE/SkfB family radical SAM enzyme
VSQREIAEKKGERFMIGSGGFTTNWRRILTRVIPGSGDPKKRNLDLFLETVRPRHEKIRNKPLQLFLEVTTACNLSCEKCGRNFFPEKRAAHFLPFSVLSEFGDYYERAFEVDTFGYGEMFLYPDLKSLVRILKSHRCKLTGITNGMLVREQDVLWLVFHRYDELTFSIDGAKPETMKRLRGADLDRVIATLRDLREEKAKQRSDLPRVIVNFVAQKDNFHELPDLIRILSDLDVYFLGVNTLHRLAGEGRKYYDEYGLSNIPREDFERVVEESRILAERAGIRFSSFVDAETEWHPSPEEGGDSGDPGRIEGVRQDLASYYCFYPWTCLYLSADRTTKVCCYMQENLGRFSDLSDLNAIWHGEGLLGEIRRAVRKTRVHPACRACVLRGRYQFSHAFVNTITEALRSVR